MKYTNNSNLPEPVFKAVCNDTYSRGDSDISCTELIGPPKIRVLKRRHEAEMTEDASDRIFSLMGQIGHGILERAASDKIAEKRFFMVRDGWKVSGQVDLVMLDDKTAELIDYKFTSLYAVKDGVKPEWRDQLNVLVVLCRENGITIVKASIVAVLRDWSKRQTRIRSDYPQTQVVVVPVPIWEPSVADNYISERIKLHKAAGENLPDCTEAERWAKPDLWKCYKPGGKRAVPGGVHTDPTSADVFAQGKGLEVRRIASESIRCSEYCPCLPFCEQGKAIVAATDNPEAE